MAKTEGKHKPIPVVAMVLAWLVPGAGHVYLGRRCRGIIIFVTIALTFWAGVGIGGVMTVDYHNERWWFAAEMLSGVHGLVGWHRQQRVYDRLAEDPQVGPPPHPQSPQRALWVASVDKALADDGMALTAPLDTVARAYAGVAGMLNLMCIFDAVMLSLLGITGERPRTLPPGKEEGRP